LPPQAKATTPHSNPDRQLNCSRRYQPHHRSTENQGHGSLLVVAPMPRSPRTIPLLLGQRQSQLGRLSHQTPPTHLPRIQQTHTRRRSYPTTTGLNQSLRPHIQQTSTCEFSLPIPGLLGSKCSRIHSTTASVICCPIQAPLRSPTNEPTSAPVFLFLFLSEHNLGVTARVYCLPTSSLGYLVTWDSITCLLEPQVDARRYGT